jgi:2-aminobenzoate-CoA ligase
VLADGVERSDTTAAALQDHVKSAIAPYKYPRSIVFTDALPKTQTGKIQRFRLREATRDVAVHLGSDTAAAVSHTTRDRTGG